MMNFLFVWLEFNATFSNISVISVQSDLLVEESGMPKENHQPWPGKWQTLSCVMWVKHTHFVWLDEMMYCQFIIYELYKTFKSRSNEAIITMTMGLQKYQWLYRSFDLLLTVKCNITNYIEAEEMYGRYCTRFVWNREDRVTEKEVRMSLG